MKVLGCGVSLGCRQWEVHDGKKWWTVSTPVEGGEFTIATGNGTLRFVNPEGRLGVKIVAAVKDHNR